MFLNKFHFLNYFSLLLPKDIFIKNENYFKNKLDINKNGVFSLFIKHKNTINFRMF